MPAADFDRLRRRVFRPPFMNGDAGHCVMLELLGQLAVSPIAEEFSAFTSMMTLGIHLHYETFEDALQNRQTGVIWVALERWRTVDGCQYGDLWFSVRCTIFRDEVFHVLLSTVQETMPAIQALGLRIRMTRDEEGAPQASTKARRPLGFALDDD